MTSDHITFGPWDLYVSHRDEDTCYKIGCLESITLSTSATQKEIMCNVRDGVEDIRRYATITDIDFTLKELNETNLKLALGDVTSQSASKYNTVGSSSTPSSSDNPEWRLSLSDGLLKIQRYHNSTWEMADSGERAGNADPSGSSTNGDVYYDQDDDVFDVYSDGSLAGLSSGWYEVDGYDENYEASPSSPSQSPNAADDLWIVIAIDDNTNGVSAELNHSSTGSSWDTQVDVSSEYDYVAENTFGTEHTHRWVNTVLGNGDVEPTSWEGITGKNPTFPTLSTHTDREPTLWGYDGSSFNDDTTYIDDSLNDETVDFTWGKQGVNPTGWEVTAVEDEDGNGITNPDGYTVGDQFSTFGRQYRLLDACLGKVRVYTHRTRTFDRDNIQEVNGDKALVSDDPITGDTVMFYGFAYAYGAIRDANGNIITSGRTEFIENRIQRGTSIEARHQYQDNQNIWFILNLDRALPRTGFSLSASPDSDDELNLDVSYRSLEDHRVEVVESADGLKEPF